MPWPEPNRYRHLFRIDVVREPAVPIPMTGTEAADLAGIGVTVRLGQFPRIDDQAVRRLTSLFPGESPVEYALRQLLIATETESPDVDHRDFASQMIAIRRGQGRFRQDLLRVYNATCCITGTSVEATLDAAHIRPYLGVGSHVAGNGLLLRTDVHTLFDLHLLTVMPFGTVRTAPELRGSHYEEFDERQVRNPNDAGFTPNPRALEQHNLACRWLS